MADDCGSKELLDVCFTLELDGDGRAAVVSFFVDSYLLCSSCYYLTGDEDYDWKGCIELLAGGRFLSVTINFIPSHCLDHNVIVQSHCVGPSHCSV